jgi:hypothetical protein
MVAKLVEHQRYVDDGFPAIRIGFGGRLELFAISMVCPWALVAALVQCFGSLERLLASGIVSMCCEDAEKLRRWLPQSVGGARPDAECGVYFDALEEAKGFGLDQVSLRQVVLMERRRQRRPRRPR